MKNIKSMITLAVLLMLLISVPQNPLIQETVATTTSSVPTEGKIRMYGELHSVEKIRQKEFELWSEYYNKDGMRHLFIEFSYYTTEFLNLWMLSDNDDILNDIYKDWVGTQGQTEMTKEFLHKIKSECPETIFHGTDVGHQNSTTGAQFLKYLREHDMEDSEQYKLAQIAIEQGQYYYQHGDEVYRENKMVENFVREYNKLNGQSVMGIYGAAHTGLFEMNYTNEIPSMANQLKQIYKDSVYSVDLSYLAHA